MKQRLLAREAPVDGGPGAAGLPGDVVEGRLAEPHPGDARERAVEDPVGLGGRGPHRGFTHTSETVLR